MEVALCFLVPRSIVSRQHAIPLHSASVWRHYNCLIQTNVFSNPPEAGWLGIQIVHLGRLISQGQASSCVRLTGILKKPAEVRSSNAFRF